MTTPVNVKKCYQLEKNTTLNLIRFLGFPEVSCRRQHFSSKLSIIFRNVVALT
jgi:hypothetical protein